eukprot:10972071-Karenia_brevis.AAC.1
MYPTIKKKCFNGDAKTVQFQGQWYPVGIMKSCVKPAHSCCRNVVSFACMPGAAAFRRVSRAFRNLIVLICGSWEIDNLAKAKNHIDDGFHKLKVSDDKKCICCRCLITTPTVVVADAPQAYEILPEKSIERNTRYVLDRAKKANCGL